MVGANGLNGLNFKKSPKKIKLCVVYNSLKVLNLQACRLFLDVTKLLIRLSLYFSLSFIVFFFFLSFFFLSLSISLLPSPFLLSFFHWLIFDRIRCYSLLTFTKNISSPFNVDREIITHIQWGLTQKCIFFKVFLENINFDILNLQMKIMYKFIFVLFSIEAC